MPRKKDDLSYLVMTKVTSQIRKGEHGVSEVVKGSGLPRKTVSRALNAMYRKGLLNVRKVGRTKLFSVINWRVLTGYLLSHGGTRRSEELEYVNKTWKYHEQLNFLRGSIQSELRRMYVGPEEFSDLLVELADLIHLQVVEPLLIEDRGFRKEVAQLMKMNKVELRRDPLIKEYRRLRRRLGEKYIQEANEKLAKSYRAYNTPEDLENSRKRIELTKRMWELAEMRIRGTDTSSEIRRLARLYPKDELTTGEKIAHDRYPPTPEGRLGWLQDLKALSKVKGDVLKYAREKGFQIDQVLEHLDYIKYFLKEQKKKGVPYELRYGPEISSYSKYEEGYEQNVSEYEA